MNEQPEALRLAEQLEHCINNAEDVTLSYLMYWHWSAKDAAAELRRLHEVNQELVETGQAVVDRWDSPLWKDLPHTADYIHKLRAAITKAKGESNE